MVKKLEKTEQDAKDSFAKYSELTKAQSENNEDTSQLKYVNYPFGIMLVFPSFKLRISLCLEIKRARGDDKWVEGPDDCAHYKQLPDYAQETEPVRQAASHHPKDAEEPVSGRRQRESVAPAES